MFFNSPGGAMDFTADSFNFRSDDYNFRLKNTDNISAQTGLCYKRGANSSASETAADEEEQVLCYQYNRRQSTGSEQVVSCSKAPAEKVAAPKQSEIKTAFMSKRQSIKQSSQISEPVDFSKYTTPIYRKPCLGVSTCPMQNQGRKISDALSKCERVWQTGTTKKNNMLYLFGNSSNKVKLFLNLAPTFT